MEQLMSKPSGASMSVRLIGALLSALLVLSTTGCFSGTGARSAADGFDVGVLRKALLDAGLQVGQPQTQADADRQSREHGFEPLPRNATLFGSSERFSFDVSDGRSVVVYRYPTPGAASSTASRVDSHGLQVPIGTASGVASVSWAGRPHFFARGRLIVLYCSDQAGRSGKADPSLDTRVLRVLEAQMGKQFAGAN
jgi:hypothetical protein